MKQENLSQKYKIKELKDTQKAILNILDDLEKERKNLQVLNVKNEAILLCIGDGLVVVDKEGKILMVNKMFENLIGWKREEAIDKFMVEVVPRQDEAGNIVPFRVTTTTTTTTCYYVRKDGTRFPASSIITPIILDKEVLGAVEVFRDITKEKEIDKMQNEFISIISHQLGTPLIGIQWTIERIFKKENLTVGLQGYLQDIHISVQRLSSLINTLLNSSRFEEGKLAVSPEQIELTAFIKEYIREFTPFSIKRGVALTFEQHPKNLDIITDRNILRNIIQSLVSNAIEYTFEGGKVKIFLEKKDDYFLLTISDTGIGIPKGEQAKIFEKFSRASNAELIKPSGSGLGLYTAKQATDLLQGKIWFKSEENRGTTFYVELPVKVKSKKGSKNLA